MSEWKIVPIVGDLCYIDFGNHSTSVQMLADVAKVICDAHNEQSPAAQPQRSEPRQGAGVDFIHQQPPATDASKLKLHSLTMSRSPEEQAEIESGVHLQPPATDADEPPAHLRARGFSGDFAIPKKIFNRLTSFLSRRAVRAKNRIT